VKATRVSIAVAVVLSLVTLNVPARLFSISVKGTEYSDSGVTKLSNANFISDCTSSNGAQLAAVIDDINSNITALVTVDSCGNILCTNMIVTVCSSQIAGSASGKGVAAATLLFATPNDSVTGEGFILASGTVSNETVVTSIKGKGTVALCSTNNDVINATFSVSGAFKPGKNCDQ